MSKGRMVPSCVMALLMLFALCACRGAEIEDVPVDTLADSVAQAIDKSESLIKMGSEYILGYMGMDVSEYEGFAVEINAYGANIDEFGIFKGRDEEQAGEIKSAVEDYLQLRLASWMDEYMPEEKPKLTCAEIKTVGTYVMYCILSDEDKQTAFEVFEKSLTQPSAASLEQNGQRSDAG